MVVPMSINVDVLINRRTHDEEEYSEYFTLARKIKALLSPNLNPQVLKEEYFNVVKAASLTPSCEVSANPFRYKKSS